MPVSASTIATFWSAYGSPNSKFSAAAADDDDDDDDGDDICHLRVDFYILYDASDF